MCKLHDEGVDSIHGNLSDIYRTPSTVIANTDPGTGVIIEKILKEVTPKDLEDFSEGFKREMSFVYRHITRKQETPSRQEPNFEGCSDDEQRIINIVIRHINNDAELPELFWQTFVKRLHYDYEREYEKTNMTGDSAENRPFSEGKYDLQSEKYIPKSDDIEEGHLNVAEVDFEAETGGEKISASLWFQYKGIDGKIKEVPLVFATEGAYSIHSERVDYGLGDYEDNISDEFAQALEKIVKGEEPTMDPLTEGQQNIIETLHNQDTEGTWTEDILQEYVSAS